MENNINIFVGGDFCPIGRNREMIEEGKFETLLGGMEKYMKESDLTILNLESPLTNSGSIISKSGPNIKANPQSIELLTYAKVNLVTLANNHIMDYGEEGLRSTLDVCKKNNISTVGAGLTEKEIKAHHIFTKGNKKIAIVNLAENEFNKIGEVGANTVDFISNYHQIKEAKKQVDYVIVIAHGGREHYQLPTPDVRERYRFFTEAGADVVVAHHPHCYGGYEIYNGKPIFYSLGNFIFDYKKKYQKGHWTEAFVLKLVISSDKIDFQLIPFFQGREQNPNIELMKGNDEKNFFEKINMLNKTIVNNEEFFTQWQLYLETQRKTYTSLLRTPNKYVRFLQAKNLLPQFGLNKEFRNVLLNINRCETHHEILKSVLENKNSKDERKNIQ